MCRLADERTSELQLVKAAQRGSTEAFATLVRLHADRVHAFILRMTRDPDLALDLTQETWLKAFRGLSSFTFESSFSTWLCRIGHNTVISWARAKKARPQVTSSLGEEGSPHIEPAVHEEAGSDLMLHEEHERALAALAHLPDDLRAILILRDIDDRSYEDIALILEIPAGTVRSRLFRAREKLRTWLSGPQT